MEFEYTSSIYIQSEDLRKMYLYVKKGGNFSTIFDDVMARYDDCDYYACGLIYDDVEKEIQRRLNQAKNN